MSRNLYAFNVLAPGISTNQQRTPGGATNLPHNSAFNHYQPTLEAVREFNVITDNFGSEFGSGTWVMNVLTKEPSGIQSCRTTLSSELCTSSRSL